MNDVHISFRVRIAPGSWQPGPFVRDGVLYSRDVRLDEADGLIALYDPSEELVRFRGPKLWYSYEPQWHSHYHKHPIGKRLVKLLGRSEWVYFANPEPRFRVPHITVPGRLTTERGPSPQPRAVGAVSNFGGRIWFLKRHIVPRTRMILCPLVDVFGRRASWAKFRAFPALWRVGPPRNYAGEPPCDFVDEGFIPFLSAYKVCVCLENSCEPHYFTEKFVNAVRAGCIPVYHAHPTVRERFLGGACWVDPSDFGFNPQRTIEHALALDTDEFRRVNDVWLHSGILDDTTSEGFWRIMCGLMREKLTRRSSCSAS